MIGIMNNIFCPIYGDFIHICIGYIRLRTFFREKEQNREYFPRKYTYSFIYFYQNMFLRFDESNPSSQNSVRYIV